MNASSNGGSSPWCSSDQKCTDSIYCNRFQIIFWAFIQIAIKPEICFAMIYSSIVFHIVHAFNYYKFSALQLHQYKWFILCNQIIVTNNLICYCYMYIFRHNKCHQAEFQFFSFSGEHLVGSSGVGGWHFLNDCGWENEGTEEFVGNSQWFIRVQKSFFVGQLGMPGLGQISFTSHIAVAILRCIFFHFSWEFLFSGQLELVRPETQKVSHFSRGPQSARLGLRWLEVGGWLVGTQVTSMVGRPTVHHLAHQHKQHTSRLLLLLDRDHLLLLLIILLSANPQATWWTLACCPLSNSLLQLKTLP